MAEESTQDENVSEEATEEVVEESSSEKTQKECIVIPDHMKPLFECCKEFDNGKIDSGDFFARALIRTGEFMENVKKKRKAEPSE